MNSTFPAEMPQHWTQLGLTQTGAWHQARRLPNQDAWITRRVVKLRTGEVLWVAGVADGAGSARQAEIGAKLACQSAERFLVANFHRLHETEVETLSTELVDYHHQLLNRWCRPRQIPLRELASTLAAVVISERGDWAAVHIGDGAIFARVAGHVKTISAPMKGEFANQTYFLTDPQAPKRLRWVLGTRSRMTLPATLDPNGTPTQPQPWDQNVPEAFMLFTDGLEPALLTTRGTAPAPAIKIMMDWQSQFAPVVVKQALAWNLREVLAPKSHDDCTLVLINRQAVPTPPNRDSSQMDRKRRKTHSEIIR